MRLPILIIISILFSGCCPIKSSLYNTNLPSNKNLDVSIITTSSNNIYSLKPIEREYKLTIAKFTGTF